MSSIKVTSTFCVKQYRSKTSSAANQCDCVLNEETYFSCFGQKAIFETGEPKPLCRIPTFDFSQPFLSLYDMASFLSKKKRQKISEQQIGIGKLSVCAVASMLLCRPSGRHLASGTKGQLISKTNSTIFI